MVNTFTIQTDVSASLNFLIYIQNMYLNEQKTFERPRFPYVAQPVSFHDDFEERFAALWKEVAQQMAKDRYCDSALFYKKLENKFSSLFTTDTNGLNNFREIRKSFEAWWGSYAGGFTLDRSLGGWLDKLYHDLAKTLKENGKEPEQHMHISLLYDECVLGDVLPYSYFAILPIEAFLVTYKQLVTEVKVCLV